MSEKWTKGPWEIRKYEDPYGSRYTAVEIATEEIIIAKLGVELDEECAANAHLIAAAPEMYEALLKCVQADPTIATNRPGWMDYVASIEGARAALKKARGES